MTVRLNDEFAINADQIAAFVFSEKYTLSNEDLLRVCLVGGVVLEMEGKIASKTFDQLKQLEWAKINDNKADK